MAIIPATDIERARIALLHFRQRLGDGSTRSRIVPAIDPEFRTFGGAGLELASPSGAAGGPASPPPASPGSQNGHARVEAGHLHGRNGGPPHWRSGDGPFRPRQALRSIRPSESWYRPCAYSLQRPGNPGRRRATGSPAARRYPPGPRGQHHVPAGRSPPGSRAFDDACLLHRDQLHAITEKGLVVKRNAGDQRDCGAGRLHWWRRSGRPDRPRRLATSAGCSANRMKVTAVRISNSVIICLPLASATREMASASTASSTKRPPSGRCRFR